jgi:hypothetical protein
VANPDQERMRRAYRVSGRLFRDRLAAERPGDDAELSAIRPAEVVVVRGRFDHMHRVLEATRVPFLHLDPMQLARADWDRMQVLLINCPGQLPDEARERIAPWVRGGGYLLTTDWALKHVLERVFPGTVRHNGKESADCVVRVQSSGDESDPLLDGFLEDGREPLWWLETASYPIEVLDAGRVRVLVRSPEIAHRWGQDPVVVTFDEGQGTVLHLLSHLYLQRGDVRDALDRQGSKQYMTDALAMSESVAGPFAAEAGDLAAAELAAALGKQRILSDYILRRRRKSGTAGKVEP